MLLRRAVPLETKARTTLAPSPPTTDAYDSPPARSSPARPVLLRGPVRRCQMEQGRGSTAQSGLDFQLEVTCGFLSFPIYGLID